MLQALGILVVFQALAIAGFAVHLKNRPGKTVERRRISSASDKIVVRPASATIGEEIAARHSRLDSRNVIGALVIEVDHLALVRDALGDLVGYELLGAVASLVKSHLRSGDYLDLLSDREIAVVTDDLPTKGDLERLSDRIMDSLSQPVTFGARSQKVTASIGMCAVPKNGNSEQLIQNAQSAKNQAKKNPGSAAQFFADSLKDEALDTLELERDLNLAIDNHEISVYYQAVIDPKSKNVDRFECFIRWFHSTRGMMRPDQFLEVANRSDLIVRLGRFVLTEACYQAADWTAARGVPITVSVNVSDTQLLGEDFVATVIDTLNKTGLPAEQLELEFSERLVFEDLDYSAQIIQSLQRTGVRVAIDNFGATNASLGLLRTLPTINTLKLDRTFIENVHVSEIERNLVASVSDFASQMGIDVVAEGVELAETARTLEDMGVEHLQGFLYQRPGPAAEAFEVSSLAKA